MVILFYFGINHFNYPFISCTLVGFSVGFTACGLMTFLAWELTTVNYHQTSGHVQQTMPAKRMFLVKVHTGDKDQQLSNSIYSLSSTSRLNQLAPGLWHKQESLVTGEDMKTGSHASLLFLNSSYPCEYRGLAPSTGHTLSGFCKENLMQNWLKLIYMLSYFVTFNQCGSTLVNHTE